MKELEKSLNETLNSSALEGITSDLGEVAIDSVIQDNVLKDVPILGTIINVAKIGVSIHNMILYKKIFRFLFEIKDIPIYKRKELYDKINESEDYGKNIGEVLLLLIDKLDDLEKPVIIGKLFAELLNDRLDFKTFLRLSHIIERIFLLDLRELRKIKAGGSVGIDIKSNLYNLGLMSRRTFGKIRSDSSNEYMINSFGEILVKILYNE